MADLQNLLSRIANTPPELQDEVVNALTPALDGILKSSPENQRNAFHDPDWQERVHILQNLEHRILTEFDFDEGITYCAWAVLHIMPIEMLKQRMAENPQHLWTTAGKSSAHIDHFLVRQKSLDPRKESRSSSPLRDSKKHGPISPTKRSREEFESAPSSPETRSTKVSAAVTPTKRSGAGTVNLSERTLSTPAHRRVISDSVAGHSSMRSASPGRSETAKKECRWRDDGKCVITGWPDPHVAHIFPFGSITSTGPKKNNFWNFLQYIWGEEKRVAWENAAQDKSFNMMCLTPTLHAFWGNARFALKPIRTEDKDTIKFELHWLRSIPKKEMTRYVPSLISPPDEVLVVQSLDREIGQNATSQSKLPESGTVFTISADAYSLPSFELLELQWHLLRLAAMTAAAEADLLRTKSGYSDSDDEILAASYDFYDDSENDLSDANASDNAL